MTKANDYQVGGDHYSRAGRYQHWDFIEDHGIGYLEGYATKYLVRWDKKGMPIQDLEKAQHITAKLIELAEDGTRHNRATKLLTRSDVELFCSANKVKGDDTALAIERLFRWKSPKDLHEALKHVQYVLEAQPARRLAREYDSGGKKSRHSTEGMEHPFGYDAAQEGATQVRPEAGTDGTRPGEGEGSKKE